MYSRAVPQELADQVIDLLHDSPESLRYCSLVCRSWLPSSRLHLHRSLSLDAPDVADEAESKFLKSCQFLVESPHLAPYVRELTLTGNECCGLSKAEVFLGVINLLTKVRTIKLARVDWVECGAELAPLNTLFSTCPPTAVAFTECNFSSISDFLPLVRSKGLRQLQLSECTFDNFEADIESHMEDQEDEPVYLQELCLEGPEQSAFVDWLLQPNSYLSLARLRHLQVETPTDQNFAVTARLLKALGASLESFHFNFSG